MTDPTEPTPAPPVTPTPPGWGPGWSRRTQRRGESGGLVFGVVLLLVGGYFLLRDTLHIRLPSLGELWPLFLIALGLWILLNAARHTDRL